MNHAAAPVGGRVLTRHYLLLLLLAGVAGALLLWRFLAGLGPVTALNDGYPWGLWIAFDVVTGTAFACGGYAVAILCYVLNKGRYHPLVRPALVTSALGYTLAAVSVVVDVGRWWLLYGVFLPWRWNLSSVLLEVALCISAYVVVLWIELLPAFLEKALESRRPRLHRLAARALTWLHRILPFLLALGLLLPTMHQSSLGSLMLVARTKLHPFWHTPWLPLLFLISCVAMGYGVVVLESLLSSLVFHRKPELPMLRGLARVMVGLQLVFLAIRWLDLILAGKLADLHFGRPLLLLLLETLLFAAPALILLGFSPPRRARLFAAACCMLLAGGLYRFDTYLLAFDPGPEWSYFPSIPETVVTMGFLATEVAVYVFLVRRFPILAGTAGQSRRETA